MNAVNDETGSRRPAWLRTPVISAIIPCPDEETAIGQVVTAVLAQNVGEVVVVDGGSRDRTAEFAEAAGARVIVEPRRGYGRAIQAGIAALRDDADILLFLDGDGSDPAEFIPDLVSPIVAGRAIFVLGSRVRGRREPGSPAPQQILAAHVGRLLLRLVYGASFTDLSPFRAIRRDVLIRLGMKEETYGWNLEMLMRVAAARLPALEIAVGQRSRIGGVSKVSGNPVAGFKAAWSMSMTFVRDQRVPARSPHATMSRGDFRPASSGGENTARYPPSPAS
ncbi:glycosyltransferase family 2 protein [Bradyrhizobium sp. Ash2021]|uniref:glycosyltransferase family 2 protein n=1 Tax=Bradyrhizobium sp. Ash2021 TaxID=2954771 RepID=UPI002814EAC4|nr:glycosyltransferase family 2 protein [Bradyrhizobium sp. Ash2021]WMT75412.1 glycosyltransferase family 2 protein [Bradyrhizobium sp. Ash2021]WMT75923.1 glycosyltransferase family 2 protein [Bradyrhizobium sp. Ash2021]